MGRSGKTFIKPLLYFLLFFLSALGLREALRILSTPEPKAKPAPAYAYFFSDIELHGWDDGRKVWKVKARKVKVGRDRSHVYFDRAISGEILGDRGETKYRFRAEQGHFFVPLEKIDIHPLAIHGEKFWLRTPKVFFSGKRKVLDFPLPIEAELNGIRFRAKKGVLYFDQEVLELKGVKGIFYVSEEELL